MDDTTESLEQFTHSFSYGKRGNHNFKFLSRHDGEAGGEVVRVLIDEIGTLIDTGDQGQLIDRYIAEQATAYQSRRVNERYRYDDSPFLRPAKPVAESKVALLTSSGHFVEGDDPKPFGMENMTQEEATRRIDDFIKEAPVLSTIPTDTPRERTRVRHGGYDISGSLADRNVTLPIDRLNELVADGTIGEFHSPAYSFPGATSQMRLLKRNGPEWAADLTAAGIDVAVLVPV